MGKKTSTGRKGGRRSQGDPLIRQVLAIVFLLAGIGAIIGGFWNILLAFFPALWGWNIAFIGYGLAYNLVMAAICFVAAIIFFAFYRKFRSGMTLRI